MLIEALPQALRGERDLLRLINDEKRAGRQVHERVFRFQLHWFGKREDLGFGDLHHTALRFDLEAADGFDFVAKEFDAERARALGGEDVEDASADGVFADHFDGLATVIADRFEVIFEGFERNFFANGERERETPVVLGSLRAEQ